jgi:preprotein translocase subunit SecA
LRQEVSRLFALEADDYAGIDFDRMSTGEIRDALWERIQRSYDEKEKTLGAELLRKIERDIMLQIVDAQWKDHLYSLDHLKEGIGLRGYGQRDPLVEYKKESFELFQAMKDRIEEEIVRYLWRLTPVLNESGAEAPIRQAPARRAAPKVTLSSPATSPPPSAFGPIGARGGAAGGPPRPARTGGDDVVRQVKRDEPKVGRNDPCPCGSGKKYKKCHGA